MRILGLLGVMFIGLKLADIIAWSWWFVLMPLYAIPLVLIILAFVVMWAEA